MNQGSTPTQRVKTSVKDESDRLASSVQDEASGLVDDARQVGQKHVEGQVERGKERVEEQLDIVASAVDDAAERLEAEGHPFASYAGELSTQLMNLSEKIETSSVDELAESTRRLAKENPALFMLGGVALGFVAARFFKAGQPSSYDSSQARQDYQQGDSYGTSQRLPQSAPGSRVPVPMSSPRNSDHSTGTSTLTTNTKVATDHSENI